MRTRISLNRDWKFSQDFEALQKNPRGESFETVGLPHTVQELPYHYFDESLYQMTAGYSRVLFARQEWNDKAVILTFEGIAHVSEVHINGVFVKAHGCGYTAFSMDIAPFLRFGEENVILVKADSRESVKVPPFGFVIDYMTYGGMYREAYIEIKDRIHIEDVYVHSDILTFSEDKREAEAILFADITLNEKIKDAKASMLLFERGSGGLIAEKEVLFSDESELSLSCKIPNARVWDLEHPKLYEVRIHVKTSDMEDEMTVVSAFRRADFRTDGFYLNDKKIKIRGLNRHQSYPYVGYAMPGSQQSLDADILKNELHVNAVRTSHYPQSHHFISRCDEIGLLVFTELPGWQHIGDEEWKQQAIVNVRDMVMQYRNHPSIILWGVRINESADDDDFYTKTNAMAHKLDPYRQTGGVRNFKRSHLLEDVYTYNDFIHDGKLLGAEPKKKVTSRMESPYLVTEYNGHMYPTKAFDWEEHRTEHALRHANVLNAVAMEEDIAGSFGWCMFDYNTHKDFGSGDRICYHGVMDMFRNPKLAALVYSCQQDEEVVLDISSSMDIGEHPGTYRSDTYILTNADFVRMYKNDRLVKEYDCKKSTHPGLKHGPVLIDDYMGDVLQSCESYSKNKAEDIKAVLHQVAKHGVNHIPKKIYPKILKLLLVHHMNIDKMVDLYTRYIGDWGGTSTEYRFEAIKNGTVVKTVVKAPMTEVSISLRASSQTLEEADTYDVSLVRIRAVDEHGNTLPFYQEPLELLTDGVIELIGPKVISLKGGMGGTYVKTVGQAGKGTLTVKGRGMESQKIEFTVNCN